MMQDLWGEIIEWVDEEEIDEIPQGYAANHGETSFIIIDDLHLRINREYAEVLSS